jgi:uncharacterized protein associated with vWA-MoxR-VMAP ternary system
MIRRIIGKVGQTSVEVCSTLTPWIEGFDGSAVVMPTGSQGQLRGRMAEFWIEQLDDGPTVVREIEQKLRQATRVDPRHTAWLTVRIPPIGGDGRLCNICVATAFDRYGPHAENAGRSAMAVLTEAKRRGFERVAMPLLGTGYGKLDPVHVVIALLTGVESVQTADENRAIKSVVIFVETNDLDALAELFAGILESRTGMAKWFDRLKQQGSFTRLRILEDLTGGYSSSSLGVCEVWDERGHRLPLSVFKIGPTDMIAQEFQRARRAADILGEYAIEARETFELGNGYSALRMPLVSDIGSGKAGLSFLAFFQSSGDPNEVASALNMIFGEAASLLYSEARAEWQKLSDLQRFMELTRGGQYWSQAAEGLRKLLGLKSFEDLESTYRLNLKTPVNSVVENPFCRTSSLSRAWGELVEVPMCDQIHGDLNPRNVLMIRREALGTYLPRMIDFNRFGERGPLPLDFARFEAGVQIKCIRDQISASSRPDELTQLLMYEALINDCPDFVPTKASSLVGVVAPEFAKSVRAVTAIRQCYRSLSPVPNPRAYWLLLVFSLLSYLRPIYDGRLSDEQRTFAVYVASLILSRHVIKSDTRFSGA